MSEQVGARTHASAAGAPHTYRLAAAGLAVLLTFGLAAAAHAGEGFDDRPDAGTSTRSDDLTDRPGEADGTIEISATSSDTDLVTLVVVTAEGRRTITVTPVPDAPAATP